ncbi:MAG: DUF1449 family protein [Pontiellaceae bacterium]|nr:DUF1449 family protein [Pontiellaceae bacterium]MBN2785222.1 DUF1449 family protein [Pontiellaceae bacterium]
MMAELQELIRIMLAGINLPITLLFAVMILYWLSVIFGALDIDILQFDFDVDIEGGADLDADADADVQGGGPFQSMLLYFNVGSVPVTVWLSFLIFTCWLLSVLETYYFNPGLHFLIGLIFVIPNLIVGMYVAKMATAPLKKVFDAMAPKNITRKSLIGQRATVSSSTVSSSFGQIVVKTDGAPITLNARSAHEISKGEMVVITHEKEPGVFTVEPFSAN